MAKLTRELVVAGAWRVVVGDHVASLRSPESAGQHTWHPRNAVFSIRR